MSITLPESMTSIGGNVFYGCSSLTFIYIPDSVKSIESRAFYDCSSLTEVTFGKGLKKITSGSFFGCKSIEKITIHATQPPATDGYIFDDAVYENATLYVPQGSISKYQVMTGWSGFYNIIEFDDTAINNAPASQAVVHGHNGIISISGAKQGEAIAIYTLDGAMVASETATAEITSVEVPTQQVYLVKVADKVVKIGM